MNLSDADVALYLYGERATTSSRAREDVLAKKAKA
jgi:hypothetical protein